MMTANWAVEVLAAWPFEHDISLVGGLEVGSTKHLPPTVSLQYHILLDDSWGVAAELGADFMLNDTWFLNLSARYIDIETDAFVNGGFLGKVEIDPWVYGAYVGLRF